MSEVYLAPLLWTQISAKPSLEWMSNYICINLYGESPISALTSVTFGWTISDRAWVGKYIPQKIMRYNYSSLSSSKTSYVCEKDPWCCNGHQYKVMRQGQGNIVNQMYDIKAAHKRPVQSPMTAPKRTRCYCGWFQRYTSNLYISKTNQRLKDEHLYVYVLLAQ